jgi:hypothetical protein
MVLHTNEKKGWSSIPMISTKPVSGFTLMLSILLLTQRKHYYTHNDDGTFRNCRFRKFCRLMNLAGHISTAPRRIVPPFYQLSLFFH